MALSNDLLEQALHLATRESKRPRQASLRRAISSAYYGLFHLLIGEATRVLAPAQPAALRIQLRRAFDHGAMKTVCRQFSARKPAASTAALLAAPIEDELVVVARTFVVLQEERHLADYDTGTIFFRAGVEQSVGDVREAFGKWAVVRPRPNATVFLAALLHQRNWDK